MPLSRRDLAEKRLFDQFSTSVRMKELIGVLLDYVEQTDDVIADLFLRRYKDAAEGVWLDIAAEIVGIFYRPGNEYIPEDMFTYRSLSDPQFDSGLGYGSIGDSNLGGRYRSIYGNFTDGTIADSYFLSIINAKIAANKSGSSIPELWDYIYNGFGARTTLTDEVGVVYVELKNEAPFLTDFERRALVQYAPVQQGTRIKITNWQTETP